MLKQRVNEAEIAVRIAPVTPLLIKASDCGADPTRPDMEFVHTYHRGRQTVYLPGSSLKGAIRSHAERIVRTVGGESNKFSPWACDPLGVDSPCRKRPGGGMSFAEKYKSSCFTCRLFGSTETASHCTIADAYPDDPESVVLEERNGVALDRKLGSVAVGPFNYQVATDGSFSTTIHLVNYSLDQLGLLALVIRDFDTQMVSLGFAKSRGLGQVSMTVESVQLKYPGCILSQGIKVLQRDKVFPETEVLGAGSLCREATHYGFPCEDNARVTVETTEHPFGIGVIQKITGKQSLDVLWKQTVGCWRKQIKGASVK